MKLYFIIGLITISIQAYSQSEKKYVRKGNSNYKEGNYSQAEVEYRKALEKEPDSYKADYNLGNALYKQKQYDAAAGRYSSLAEKESDREKRSRYFYNLGNTYFENNKYKESIEAYKEALRNNPSDTDAKHNLQLALRMLHEQQQQQQNKDKKGQNSDNNNQDNQNNQDQQNQQKNQDQQDQKNNQDQQNDQQENNQQPQPVKGQISREDAERILQALENDEKEVMKRVQERKEQVRKVPVDKNW